MSGTGSTVAFRYPRIEELRELAGDRKLAEVLREHTDRLFSGVRRPEVVAVATRIGRAEARLGAAEQGSEEWETATKEYQTALLELNDMLEKVGVPS